MNTHLLVFHCYSEANFKMSGISPQKKDNQSLETSPYTCHTPISNFGGRKKKDTFRSFPNSSEYPKILELPLQQYWTKIINSSPWNLLFLQNNRLLYGPIVRPIPVTHRVLDCTYILQAESDVCATHPGTSRHMD